MSQVLGKFRIFDAKKGAADQNSKTRPKLGPINAKTGCGVQGMIRIRRCKTVEDAVAVRKSYVALPSDIDNVVVDLSSLDRGEPDALLIGVLLNIRTFFKGTAQVRLANCPDYLARLLKICRREQLFVFNDHADSSNRVYH